MQSYRLVITVIGKTGKNSTCDNTINNSFYVSDWHIKTVIIRAFNRLTVSSIKIDEWRRGD